MKYHDSQVSFFKNKNQEGLFQTLDLCRPLVGNPIYDIQTEKVGKITAVIEYNNNVYLRVLESN